MNRKLFLKKDFIYLFVCSFSLLFLFHVLWVGEFLIKNFQRRF